MKSCPSLCIGGILVRWGRGSLIVLSFWLRSGWVPCSCLSQQVHVKATATNSGASILNRLDLDEASRPISRGRQVASRQPKNKDRRKSIEGNIVAGGGVILARSRVPFTWHLSSRPSISPWHDPISKYSPTTPPFY